MDRYRYSLLWHAHCSSTVSFPHPAIAFFDTGSIDTVRNGHMFQDSPLPALPRYSQIPYVCRPSLLTKDTPFELTPEGGWWAIWSKPHCCYYYCRYATTAVAAVEGAYAEPTQVTKVKASIGCICLAENNALGVQTHRGVHKWTHRPHDISYLVMVGVGPISFAGGIGVDSSLDGQEGPGSRKEKRKRPKKQKK